MLETLLQLQTGHVGSPGDGQGADEKALSTGIAAAATAQLPLLLAAYGATLGGADRALLRVLLAVEGLVGGRTAAGAATPDAPRREGGSDSSGGSGSDSEDADQESDAGLEAVQHLQGRLASWGCAHPICLTRILSV